MRRRLTTALAASALALGGLAASTPAVHATETSWAAICASLGGEVPSGGNPYTCEIRLDTETIPAVAERLSVLRKQAPDGSNCTQIDLEPGGVRVVCAG